MPAQAFYTRSVPPHTQLYNANGEMLLTPSLGQIVADARKAPSPVVSAPSPPQIPHDDPGPPLKGQDEGLFKSAEWPQSSAANSDLKPHMYADRPYSCARCTGCFSILDDLKVG